MLISVYGGACGCIFVVTSDQQGKYDGAVCELTSTAMDNGPDEDNRVYGPSRNDALFTLESLRSLPRP